jgi:hypothetical protein
MLHHHYFLRGVGARRVAVAPRSSFHCWTQPRQHHCSYYYHRYNHCWVGSSSSSVSSTTEAAAATTQRRTSTTPQLRTTWNNYGSSSSTAAAAATPHCRTYQQQYYCRSFSISRHPDPLTRHGTINSLDDDDLMMIDGGVTSTTTTNGDLDGGLSRGGGIKKVVLTADDMDYLDEFLGLDQLSSSTDKKDKRGGTSANKTKGRGMDYNNLFSSIDNDDDDDDNNNDDDDDIIGHSSFRTSRSNKNNKGGTTMSSEEIAYAE